MIKLGGKKKLISVNTQVNIKLKIDTVNLNK